MATQHQAPLAAFVIVTVVAGAVAAQSLHGDRAGRTSDTVAATSTPSVQVPRAVAPPPPPSSAAPAGAPTPTTPTSGAGGPSERPSEGDAPAIAADGLPPGLIDVIPGLAAFLGSGAAQPPASGPGEQAPPTELGPTAGPSEEPSPTEPSPSGQPSPSPTTSPDPTPTGSPTGSPGPSGGAERPVEQLTGQPTGQPTGSPTP